MHTACLQNEKHEIDPVNLSNDSLVFGNVNTSVPPKAYYMGCTFIEIGDQLYFHNKQEYLPPALEGPPFIELRNSDLILMKDSNFVHVIDSLKDRKIDKKYTICELVSLHSTFSKRNLQLLKSNLSIEKGFVWYSRNATPEELGVLSRVSDVSGEELKFGFDYHRISSRNNSAKSYKCYNYPYTLYDSIYYIPFSPFEKDDPFYFKVNLRKDSFNRKFNKLLESRTVKVNSNQYEVYKFTNAYSDPATDGVANFFFTPKIGMILIYSVSWGNYEKLINSSKVDITEIDYLTSQIISDSLFLRGL
jgi:hypothetical protein